MNEIGKRGLATLSIVLLAIVLWTLIRINGGGSPASEAEISEEPTDANTEIASIFSSEDSEAALPSLIIPDGETLGERIAVPDGYTRLPAKEGSFAQYLRNYRMKPDQSPVLLHNGEEKWNQSAHAAIFSLPVSSRLQQCADTIMCLYAEYYWENGQPEKISFHFTNQFAAEYTKWRDGYRIKVSGKKIKWTQTASYDDSHENLLKYLHVVYAYAGTLSMNNYETAPTSIPEAQAGDVFIKGGSPGHVIMIVDLCETEDGKRAFLLAQGSMPAQEFHVLKNDLHPNDPWYYEEEIIYPFVTPEYTFDEGSLKHLTY